MPRHRLLVVSLLALSLAAAACGGKKPPVARPTQPPPESEMPAARPPTPPEPIPEPRPVTVPAEPSVSSADMGSLDEINKKGILQPVFFALDNAEISSEGQAVLA